MMYGAAVTEDIRLCVLRALAEAPAYTASEMVLRDRLIVYGHHISRDHLRTQLAWLEEQGLVITQQPGGVWLATLTAPGEDAVHGASRVPGVARPRLE